MGTVPSLLCPLQCCKRYGFSRSPYGPSQRPAPWPCNLRLSTCWCLAQSLATPLALSTLHPQTYSAISRAAIATAPSPPKLVACIQWWSNDTFGNPCSGRGGAISVNYPACKTQLTRVRQ